MKQLIVFVMLITVLLSACGAPAPLNPPLPPTGQIYSAYTGTTLYWLNQAVLGNPKAFVMSDGTNYLFGWATQGGGVGFTMLKNAALSAEEVIFETPSANWLAQTFRKGMIANYADTTNLVDYLKQQGWKLVPASQLPILLKQAITQAYKIMVSAGKSAIALMLKSTDLVSIFVMPVGANPAQFFGDDPYELMPNQE